MAALDTAPATEAPKAVEKPRAISLLPKDFQAKEFMSRDYFATIPEGHTLLDLLNPTYWAHVAQRQLRTNTCIFARADTFTAYLIVTSSGDTWAKCQVLWKLEHDPKEVREIPAIAQYKIDKVSGGWRVIHKDTGTILATGLTNRDAADEFRDQYIAQQKN